MNKLVNKAFSRHEHYLVRDPANSLRTGDIIEISPGWRVSKNVRHVVTKILAPFGSRIEDRPKVPTEEERIKEYEAKKSVKDERRRLRKEGLVDENGNPILRLEGGKNSVEKRKKGDKRRVESDVD